MLYFNSYIENVDCLIFCMEIAWGLDSDIQAKRRCVKGIRGVVGEFQRYIVYNTNYFFFILIYLQHVEWNYYWSNNLIFNKRELTSLKSFKMSYFNRKEKNIRLSWYLNRNTIDFDTLHFIFLLDGLALMILCRCDLGILISDYWHGSS